MDGPVNTGLAIANPNDGPAFIQFYFTDTSGTRFAEGSFDLGAHEQTAKFLDQPPFNGGGSVLGTFTFTSSVPIAAVALRGFTNEAGEFLMTTLPVALLSSPASGTVYFPHFADGNGWATQVILVNPTDRTITGTVGFLGPGSGTVPASPVILALADGFNGIELRLFDSSPQRSEIYNVESRCQSGGWLCASDSQQWNPRAPRDSLSFLLPQVERPFRRPGCPRCQKARHSGPMSKRLERPNRRVRSEADWPSPTRGPHPTL